MKLAVVVVVVVIFFFSLSACCVMTSASVVLIGANVTLSFDDVEANFAPAVKSSGECGLFYLAEPLDACSDLTNKVEKASNISSSYVLIIRGGCSFEDKVRRAQKAGFEAAIVYDNEDDGILVSMAGNSSGIEIHAVFISKYSGEKLKNYARMSDVELWLIPSFGNSAWSIMALSFISLLAMSAVLATCFFVRRHRIRREQPRSSCVRGFHGMSSRLVKAMPSLIFTTVLEDNCTSMTCAICLEDYSVGEKLRILPCQHSIIYWWLLLFRSEFRICSCKNSQAWVLEYKSWHHYNNLAGVAHFLRYRLTHFCYLFFSSLLVLDLFPTFPLALYYPLGLVRLLLDILS